MFFEQLTGTTFGQVIVTAVVSMIPVGELRVGLPFGVSLGLPWYLAFISSVVGNILPVPFIILFTRPLFEWVKDKTKLGGIIEKLERRIFRKADKVYQYEMLGLFILVAIPLPGTGAWTGAMIAALLDLRLKNAFPSIALGVIAAGIIVSVITHGFTLLI
jgi:uncharacterized membrane protein